MGQVDEGPVNYGAINGVHMRRLALFWAVPFTRCGAAVSALAPLHRVECTAVLCRAGRCLRVHVQRMMGSTYLVSIALFSTVANFPAPSTNLSRANGIALNFPST